MAKKKKKGFSVQDGTAQGATSETVTAVVGGESEPKQGQSKPALSSGAVRDPRLIPRIREYLDSRKNKKFVSITAIVEHLQSKYQEYGRKKKNMFAQYVEKAYAILERRERTPGDVAGSSGQDVSDRDSDSDSVEEILVEYKDTNAVNNMMSNLYRSSPSLSASTSELEEKKRKSELTDSMTKRQRLEVGNIGSSTSQNKENGSGVCFFIDRKGETVDKGLIRSADDSRTVNGDCKSVPLSKNSKVATPVKGADSGKFFYNDSTVGSVQSETSTDAPVVGNKETDLEVFEAESKNITDIIKSDSSKSTEVVAETDMETTATPSKGRSEKLGRRKGSSKSRKQDDTDQEEEKSKKEKGPAVQKSSLTFADVGGNEQNLQEICKLLVHMRHPEVYQRLGVTPPRGFLLHGPPGCGKTLLANAIAGELDLPLIKLASTEIVSGVSGDSEEKIRELFEKALECSPCVMFIDEIDAITPKRETASKDMERRIVAQLLSCMDELNANPCAQVLVIGATNRPDSLDPALRRAGRFDREICLGIPDEQSRLRILDVLCRGLRLSLGFDFLYLAKNTPGYVGADLMALTREAAMAAVNRVFQELQSQKIPNQQESDETSMEIDGQDSGLASHCHDLGATVIDNVPNDENITNSGATCATQKQSMTGNSEQNNSSAMLIDVPMPSTESGANPESVSEGFTDDQTIICASSEPNCTTEARLPSQDNIIGSSQSVDSSIYVHQRSNSESDTKILEANGVAGSHGFDVSCDSTLVRNSKEKEGSNTKTGSPVTGDSSNNKGDDSWEILNLESSGEHSGIIQPLDVGLKEPGGDCKASKMQVKQPELISVLSWLKEQPPLTEAQLNDLYITMDDFKDALQHVQPSAKREGFATVPDVTWEDVGALHHVREELQLAILAPVRHAEEFRSLGLNRAQGVLLAGPPGCGKTLLAKAVANESGINFISVKGPELLNMYVGESEKAVRTVFQRARNSSPCVIFFDELDALCPRRSGTADSGSSSRVVNQLLTEMDGLEERKQVFIMAATNRPDIIDPAVLRPGRLDKTLYVGLPTQQDRLDIFKCITKDGTRPCLARDVDLVKLAADQRCEGFTGADLAALVREASVLALKEAIVKKGRQPGDTIIVKGVHFEESFGKIKPSVSVKDREKYQSLGQRLSTVS